ncbi:TetR/AcrR family transcriptional regulator [Nocardia crassostreae]|uniref:TetR/AcrR family transcriptional regulator n=1 Tax=Nocardia crassostreae TaxID=53428 RepID=UPI00082ACD3E|nr:TetR family transcriptional regulator [Nocardia crassostreae]
MPTKREQLLDSAIELLGSRGSRALTHRAVDAAAGMPSGSSSNYFRTRETLLAAIAERLEERDYADWNAVNRMPAPATIPQLADALALFITHAATTDRTRTLARYALVLEAQTTPALQDSMRRGHDRIIQWFTAMVREVTPRTDAAKLLADYFDGVLWHELTSPAPQFDPRPGAEHMIRALLGER